MSFFKGVVFSEAWTERLTVEIDGAVVPAISRRHLVQNKRALGRAQDLADLERLDGDGDAG